MKTCFMVMMTATMMILLMIAMAIRRCIHKIFSPLQLTARK